MNLPDEVLLEVLACLQTAQDLARSAAVCRRWATIEQSERTTLWRRLALRLWPDAEEIPYPLNWKSRCRLLLRRGQPVAPPVPDDPPTLSERLKRISAEYEFTLELRSIDGCLVATIPTRLSAALESPIPVNSAAPHAELFLGTDLLLETPPSGPNCLDSHRLPIGFGPSQEHNVPWALPYGSLHVRILVRRLTDQHVAMFVDELLLRMEDTEDFIAHHPTWPRPCRTDSVCISNWENALVPFSTARLPGDGQYALVQRDVDWNIQHRLGVGFEIECADEGRPVQMFLGLCEQSGIRTEGTGWGSEL
jgi:hypothetical protein